MERKGTRRAQNTGDDYGAHYLRVLQIAERLNVSPSLVYRLVESGEIPAVRIGATLRVPVAAFEAFERRQLAAMGVA